MSKKVMPSAEIKDRGLFIPRNNTNDINDAGWRLLRKLIIKFMTDDILNLTYANVSCEYKSVHIDLWVDTTVSEFRVDKIIASLEEITSSFTFLYSNWDYKSEYEFELLTTKDAPRNRLLYGNIPANGGCSVTNNVLFNIYELSNQKSNSMQDTDLFSSSNNKIEQQLSHFKIEDLFSDLNKYLSNYNIKFRLIDERSVIMKDTPETLLDPTIKEVDEYIKAADKVYSSEGLGCAGYRLSLYTKDTDWYVAPLLDSDQKNDLVVYNSDIINKLLKDRNEV